MRDPFVISDGEMFNLLHQHEDNMLILMPKYREYAAFLSFLLCSN